MLLLAAQLTFHYNWATAAFDPAPAFRWSYSEAEN
jgi:hypothetical protein